MAACDSLPFSFYLALAICKMNKHLSNSVAFQLLLQSFIVCFVCLFQIDTLKKKIEKRRVKISKVTERFDVFAFDSLTEYDKRKHDFGPNWWSSTDGELVGSNKSRLKKNGIICKPYLIKLHKLTQI